MADKNKLVMQLSVLLIKPAHMRKNNAAVFLKRRNICVQSARSRTREHVQVNAINSALYILYSRLATVQLFLSTQ